MVRTFGTVIRSSIGRALVVSLVCAGSAAADEMNGALATLYRESGLEQQMIGLPGQIREGFVNGFPGQAPGGGLAPEAVLQIETEIARAFDPQTMRATVIEQLGKRLEEHDVAAAIEWLRSADGRRFTQMEERASTAEAYALSQAYARDLASNPPAPERLARIERLLSATNALEVAVTMALNTQVAVVTAIVAASPGADGAMLAHAVGEIERMRPAFTQMIEGQVLSAFLYTYRDADDAALDRYVAFAVSSAGTRYHDAVHGALEVAMVAASQRLGRAIAQALHGRSA